MEKISWPKKETAWVAGRILFISIPFTWNLLKVKADLMQKSFFWDHAVLGGPAVYAMPELFENIDHVTIGYPGKSPLWESTILQRVNPLATKTTTGCIRRCEFCAVPKTEGKFKELYDWPDLPVLIDNNLLAASLKHFDRVIDRLKRHKKAIDGQGSTVDFNQGVDARLLKKYHADRIAEIKRPIVRLSLDSINHLDKWKSAFEKLRKAGLPKRAIRSYALIGFDSGVDDAWIRCEYINSFGIKALPMWFHELNALDNNIVTEDQKKLGWTDIDRKLIMQYYYQRGKGVAQRFLKKHKDRLQKLYSI